MASGSLGVATLLSEFDPAGLQSGLDSAYGMTNSWLNRWQGAWTTAIGFIMARVVESVVRGLAQMGQEVFKALSDMQTRTIQMTGLMAQEIRDAVNPDASLADFFDEGAIAAEEMLDWVKQIAVTTPFTVQSLLNTTTMAMAFGMTSDMAQETTLAIGNFTAGMGLGNEVLERIVYNFGQMISAGKITGTELRDLSRGALVPVNDVLKIMQENLGLTGMSFEEFKENASEGEYGVQSFIDAFIEMTERDFPTAMENMGKTWSAVSSNITDFLTQVLGVEVLGPAFNNMTAGLANVFSQVLENEELMGAFTRLGESIGNLFQFDAPLDLEGILNGIADGVNTLANALYLLEDFGLESALSYLGVPDNVIDNIFKLGDGLLWAYDNWMLFAGIIVAMNIIPWLAGVASTIWTLVTGFMGMVAIEGSVVAAISGIGAAIMGTAFPWILIIGLIVAALIGLYLAWTNNWWGIRDAILGVWAILQPILFMLWDFISFKISTGISNLSALWSGVLLPAIMAVWGWIQTNLFPLFEALAAFMEAVFTLAITVLAGAWENIFLPAITKVSDFIKEKVQPVFEKIGNYIKDKFKPVLDALSAFVKGTLASSFTTLEDVIKKVVDIIWSMVDAINSIEIPDVLTPGSPTPFEIGLWGIYEALKKVNNFGLKDMSMRFDAISGQTNIPAGYEGYQGGNMGSYSSNPNDRGSGNQNNFYLRDTDLDEEQLTSLLTRQEALYGN